MSGVRKVTTVVPAGPRNSVGLDRGFSSWADFLVMVMSPLVTDEFEGGIVVEFAPVSPGVVDVK